MHDIPNSTVRVSGLLERLVRLSGKSLFTCDQSQAAQAWYVCTSSTNLFSNFVLMDAMGPNVAGVIGSAVAAGVLLRFLGS